MTHFTEPWINLGWKRHLRSSVPINLRGNIRATASCAQCAAMSWHLYRYSSKETKGQMQLPGNLSGHVWLFYPVFQMSHFSMLYVFFFLTRHKMHLFVSQRSSHRERALKIRPESTVNPRTGRSPWFEPPPLSEANRDFSLHAAFAIRVTALQWYLVSCKAFPFTKSEVNCWYCICA